MALSNDVISQFVKVTAKKSNTKSESIVYGTAVEFNGTMHVRIDGSELLTPISSTADIKEGERVTVMIKNHIATVTGNITSPAARTDDVKEIAEKVGTFDVIIAGKADIKDLEAETARIDNLEVTKASVDDLEAEKARIDTLEATDVDIKGRLTANEADISKLQTDKLDATEADIKFATIESLDSEKARIDDLDAKKLSATDAEIKYANIDFANIGDAAIKNLYAKSGVIQDVVISDGQVTGRLVGVTIVGDLIEAGTVVADKLVILGEDGLYYKLNTNGETISSEQTEYNSLSGTIITAKSITAEKVAVDDLVAFDATIGGFNITDHAIYSGVKSSVDNTTRGIYLDNYGQIAFGDASNYLKYFKDTDGNYKLEISAKSIKMSASGKALDEAVEEAQKAADAAIIASVEEFYKSTSPTELSGGSWSLVQPSWTDGTYIWRRTKNTYGSGVIKYSPDETGVCITGNTGASGTNGEDATTLRIESSRGTVFKNDNVSTVLSVVIYHGSQRITDSATMKSVFGSGAYLQWKWQRLDEDSFGVIVSSDSRFGNDGFTFTLSPDDVDTKITFMCELIT